MMKNNFFLLFLIYRYIFSGHYLLSCCRYGVWGRKYKYSYSQDDELWSNLWFVWVLHIGLFHFYMAHHSSQYEKWCFRAFLRFGIKWNIRSPVFAPGKNRTFIFLLLENFASLRPAIIESHVINVVPFLHSSDCSGGSISDEMDRDALFLASLVYVSANTGWGTKISLFFSVAVPCSSLWELLLASVFA